MGKKKAEVVSGKTREVDGGKQSIIVTFVPHEKETYLILHLTSHKQLNICQKLTFITIKINDNQQNFKY